MDSRETATEHSGGLEHIREHVQAEEATESDTDEGGSELDSSTDESTDMAPAADNTGGAESSDEAPEGSS